MTCWDYLICDNKLPEGVQMNSQNTPWGDRRYQVDHSEVGGYYADMNYIKVDKDWRVWFSCVNGYSFRPAHDFEPTNYTGMIGILDNHKSDEPGLLWFDCVDGVVVRAESHEMKERREKREARMVRKAKGAARAQEGKS